jgi:signal transduction histidine kinase
MPLLARLTRSLRVRLLVLVLLAAIPAAYLLLSAYRQARDSARNDVQVYALQIARVAVSGQDRLADNTHQMLLTLAAVPAVRDGQAAACNRLLADLLERNPIYANVGVANRAGDLWCSGVPQPNAVNISDRSYFRLAIETESFSVGEYQIGRVTGAPAVNFGLPIDDDGQIVGVLFAALDLQWFTEFARSLQLEEGSTMTVMDREGTVLARYPNPSALIGRNVRETPLAREVITHDGDGTAELPGLDGVERLYGYTARRGTDGSPDLFITVGTPTEAAYSEIDAAYRGRLIAMGVALGLMLLLAWLASELFFMRRLRALLAAIGLLSRGDYTVRTGLPHDSGEMGQLATAFDAMAASLQQAREEEAREAELRLQNVRLEQEARAAQEANRLKDEFVSMVSHELRSPLTSVRGYVDLLLEGSAGGLSTEQREFLQVVNHNSGRMLSLINDLLDIARIESGRVQLNCQPVEVDQLVAQAAESLRPQIEAKSQVMDVALTGDVPRVWADPDRGVQILVNLLSNASKYTPEQGRIRLDAVARGPEVEIRVRDTGVGIPPEQLEQLFTRFFRVSGEAARMAGGTGLGLVITKALVEAQGGSISVESEPGVGSTFAFTLPTVDAVEHRSAIPDQPAQV